jgi:hypothetical protein
MMSRLFKQKFPEGEGAHKSASPEVQILIFNISRTVVGLNRKLIKDEFQVKVAEIIRSEIA